MSEDTKIEKSSAAEVKVKSTRSTHRIDFEDTSSPMSRAIFILLGVMMILSVIAYGAVDIWMLGINSILAGLIVIFWLFDTWKTNEFRFNTSFLQIPLLGLIVIGLIQLLPLRNLDSAEELISVEAVSTLSMSPYATRFFVIQMIVYAVFFAAALTFVNNRRRFQSVILAVIIFGSLIAFYGILQYLARPEAIYGLRSTPQSIPFASFFNQHHFAAFMEMTLGLTLGLFFGQATRKNKRVFLIIAAVIMGMAVIFTGSRGGMVSFLGVLGFVILANFLISRKAKNAETDESSETTSFRRNVSLLGGGFFLLVILVGSVLLLGGDRSLLRGIGLEGVEGDISTGRSHFWWVAWQIFVDHPILGSGLDSYGTVFTHYDTRHGLFRVEQAHNDYLQILSDAGIFGFICVIAFIYMLFKQGLKAIERSSDIFLRNAIIGSLAGLCGILIHSFFDFPLRTPANAFYFLMLATLATVTLNYPKIYRKRIRVRTDD